MKEMRPQCGHGGLAVDECEVSEWPEELSRRRRTARIAARWAQSQRPVVFPSVPFTLSSLIKVIESREVSKSFEAVFLRPESEAGSLENAATATLTVASVGVPVEGYEAFGLPFGVGQGPRLRPAVQSVHGRRCRVDSYKVRARLPSLVRLVRNRGPPSAG